MNNANQTSTKADESSLDTIRRLTEQRDELLKSTETLLALVKKQFPSMEELMELNVVRAAIVKARGDLAATKSGKMVEIPIEDFYKFDFSTHDGRYSIKVDTEARYGFFEDDEQGDEHGGNLWFSPTPDGDLALARYDGVHTLPSAVIEALELQGFKVANRFK